MNRLIAALLVSVLAALSFGQTPPKQPEVTELSKLKLLNAYKDALLKQAAVTKAQADFQAAVTAYQGEAAVVIKDEKLPEGTGFNVDSEKNTVVVVLPAPKPEPQKPQSKPDEQKTEKK